MRKNHFELAVELEVTDSSGTKSWEVLEKRFGRIAAYKVSRKTAESRRMLASGEHRRLDSLVDLNMDTSNYLDHLIEESMPIVECDSTKYHLRKVDDEEQERILSNKNVRCVDLSGGDISGGNEVVGATENIVIVEFVHCKRDHDPSSCATKAEFEQRFADTHISLHIFTDFIDMEDFENPIGHGSSQRLLLDTK